MDKKHTFSNFGFSTILLGFSMMCIITFSALALLTANSDYKLSQKVAEKNTAYYEVEKDITHALADIDKALWTIYDESTQSDEYYQKVFNELSTHSEGQVSIKEHDLFYHFSQRLSNSQTIEVTIKILYPNKETDSFYAITQWQTITDTDIETDDTLHLIGDN